MTVKDYLIRIREMELDLRRIEEELEVCKSRTERITSNTSPKVQSTQDRTETIIAHIEKQKQFEREWDNLIKERETFDKVLTSMDSRILATIIWARYIKCETWEEIAVRLKTNIRWVHRLHGRALCQFGNIYKTSH